LSAIGLDPQLEMKSFEASMTKDADRQLLIDSRVYAHEIRWKSWWHLLSSVGLLFFLSIVAASADSLWLRGLSSLLTALTLIRVFTIYHDYQHHTVFKGSRLAAGILWIYGCLMLTPPTVWKRSHDHHHRHNSKMFGASIGSFPIMTTDAYRAAPLMEQIEYRIARSPMIILAGYFTVFLYGMCIRPLFLDFRRHWDSLAAIAMHFGLILVLGFVFGWQASFFSFMLPTWLAMAMGAYLFYIQHNFPAAKIRRCGQWTYTDAALESSSFLELGPVMNWFTGNIGYHHVHHLNAKIPFYRLPEAMAGLPALQSPARTSLKLREILNCMQLKLWDVERDQFVTFRAALPLNQPR
jgi:omega-6 fatty acid desaturase (delta-12 desaturase)